MWNFSGIPGLRDFAFSLDTQDRLVMVLAYQRSVTVPGLNCRVHASEKTDIIVFEELRRLLRQVPRSALTSRSCPVISIQ